LLRQDDRYIKTIHELVFLRQATLSPKPIPIKLILETSQLSEVQIIVGTVLAGYAGFDYVETSTGYVGAGAHIKNVALMRATCEKLHKKHITKKKMGVKASGDIMTLDDVEGMLRAGATRIGTNNGVEIAREARELYGD
jgi:deoxyribose-phosphate aldolase